jgi:S-adenosylmethionine hydrolase
MTPPCPASGIVTLTTDFGLGSPYVAAMKGVILTLNPKALIVDLTHAIRPQDITAGAWALAEVADRFPPGTVHVAVVDPGVGTERRILHAQVGDWQFVGPDNGLISRLALRYEVFRMIALEEPRFWLPRVSATFHGRDIMAPVAARLAAGLDPSLLGSPVDDFVRLAWPEVLILPGKIQGSIASIDSFGNLISDITAEMLVDTPTDERVQIVCDEHETQGIFRTYADQPPMTLVALVGSSGHLELAIIGDSAELMLGVKRGTPITVRW